MPSIREVIDRAWQLHQSGKVTDAENIYRRVLEQLPDNPETLVYLGIAQFDQRRFDDSIVSYRQALSKKDEFPIAWNNLGNSLRMIGEIDEAEACFEKAMQQDPDYLSAHVNRGTLWVWTGAIERGLGWYQKGLELDPGNVELHRNLGVIELLLGNYDTGWREYRWRWSMPGTFRPACSAPIWGGEPLDGKSILLYPEQGRGDAIQFVRMGKVLNDAGANVILQCSKEMIPLFQSAEGISQIFPYEAATPSVHYQASLIDAVDVWYTIHAEMAYASDHVANGYLTVSQPLVDYWADWMAGNCVVDDGVKRIGINWQGNRQHHADVYRSLPLSELRLLSELPNVQLINLQFGDGVEQLAEVEFADQIIRLPDHVDSDGGAFTDTAAIVKNLDAVVTSDTALAHLSGAVGTKTHVLLGRVPDWRWLLSGDDTPWYPSMRLWRQTEIGNWHDVVKRCSESI